MQPNRNHADEFLACLDPTATGFCFQTFDDLKIRCRKDLVHILNGSLQQHFDELSRLSAQGAGVFVTVNATDGEGRRLRNLKRLRAIFQEADQPGAPVPPLTPHIEVETSPGKFHRYWLVAAAHEPLLENWRCVMRRMVTDWSSDPNAKDPTRVLRLPGFPHQKDPENKHLVRLVAQSPREPYSWAEITAVLPPAPPERSDHVVGKGKGINCPLQLRSALLTLDPDESYHSWVTVGMALHHADGHLGFALWDDWSARGGQYTPGECADKWRSFGGYGARSVGLGTIFGMAKAAGWNWLDERAMLVETAREISDAMVTLAATDSTAHLNADAIEALQILQAEDPLAYESQRDALKRANKEIRIGALDKLVGGTKDSADRVSMASQLADLAADLCALWHDADGKAFASFERQVASEPMHLEHWAIESSAFREWLSWLAHSELGTAPSGDILKTVQNVLSGKAKFDGDQHATALRIAKDSAGYWIDIGDEAWRALLVTATGWRMVDRPPVRFRRNKAMRSLPIPVAGGDLNLIWQLVNVPEDDRMFVLAWLLESLRPCTPYAVLELVGEQGSAKSTTQRVLRHFIDPNKAMLRPAPKTREDIFVSAGTNHVVSLENLSGLSPEFSDALCTIATGGGMTGRKFYTNDEENIVEAHNPVILNGIGAIISRADLLDRAIVICPPVIEQRLTETEIAAQLAQHAPSIMGGLLDLFVLTLAELPKVTIAPDQLPRMADFAYLGEAMHRCMGARPFEFLDRYCGHRREATRRTIDASPVAAACIKYLDAGKSHQGTVGALLDALEQYNGRERHDYWPRSPKGMGDAFRRAAPALRILGIDAVIESKPRRDGVHCCLRPGSYEVPAPQDASMTRWRAAA